jgi:hypothetical protein
MEAPAGSDSPETAACSVCAVSCPDPAMVAYHPLTLPLIFTYPAGPQPQDATSWTCTVFRFVIPLIEMGSVNDEFVPIELACDHDAPLLTE